MNRGPEALNERLAAPLLTDADMRQYWAEGYVVARRVLDPAEVEKVGAECARVWALPGLIAGDSSVVLSRDTLDGGRIPERLEWISEHSELIAGLLNDRRFVAAATTILGETAVPFKDRFTLRPPLAMGYGLHQDYPYWSSLGVPADSVVSVVVALDPSNEDSGGLEVFAGYHGARLPGRPDEPRDVDETTVETSRARSVALNPGDALFMHSLAPHRSGANRASHPRRMLFLIYAAARYEGAASKLRQSWEDNHRLSGDPFQSAG
jgi:2-aminoethylphosphonate dioxygenase